MPGLTWYSRL